MEKYQITEISGMIREIRKQGRLVSNYYYQFSKNTDIIFDVCRKEKAVAFGFQDVLAYRVYFCSADGEELAEVLHAFPEDAVIDIIAKETEDWKGAFHFMEDAGFCHHATFERYHIKDLKNGIHSHIPEDLQGLETLRYGRFAETEEAEEIYCMLEETFDAHESHLQSVDAIRRMIEGKNIRVIEEDGKIVTLVTYWEEGKKLYVEHAVNVSQSEKRRENMHCLYLGVLERKLSEGINYVYTWINEKNERIRRFIYRFGYEKEDVVDYIFVKGK